MTTLENIKEYKRLRLDTESEGFTIKAISIEGKRGVFSLFADILIHNESFPSTGYLDQVLNKKSKALSLH